MRKTGKKMTRINSLYFILLCSVLLTMAHGSSNTTAEIDDDDEDDLDMDFETFKSTIKRYRRLIPYLSHYVAHNHVNNQVESPIYDGSEVLNPPQRLVLRPDRLRPQHQQLTTTLIKQEKFVPSVQYDPKNIGGDNEYFTPVRYTKPVTYDDYYRDYDRRPVYPDITTAVKVPDNRYYTKIPRPQKNAAYMSPTQKPVPNIYHDYFIDYVQRQVPGVQYQEYYPVEGIDAFKYVKIEPPRYQQTRIPVEQLRRPVYSHPKASVITDENILKSLQLTNQLPEMLSRDNIDASIKTLVEILSLLQSKKPENTPPVHLSEPVVSQNIPSHKDMKEQHYSRPKVVTETRYQVTPAPSLQVGFKQTTLQNNGGNANSYADYGIKNQQHIEYYQPVVQDIDENGNMHDYETQPPYKVESSSTDYERPYKMEEKPYTTQGNYEITENVDEDGGDKQVVTTEPPKHFQLAEGMLSDALNIPTMAIKYGATRGKPNIDYPAYAAIPQTDFSCKQQRYKGFFGDPSTGCQVWHYCDLNGGKSSFLCPNGTIFSQAALTCDWWFNVKCESTTQLYVLNERLYKFILPIMPKFPEDFSGPEVDRYLEMKFKEMEAKMKAKKLKKAMEKKKIDKTTTASAIE